MIAVDTNVLIASHRGEHPLHAVARSRLTELAEGDIPWGVPIFCVAEFIRVVTHPKVFSPPSRLETSLVFIDRLMASPTVRSLAPSERYWGLFRRACEHADARGNLVFDAQIAAVCQEHGANRLITEDHDFARFPAIERIPLSRPGII